MQVIGQSLLYPASIVWIYLKFQLKYMSHKIVVAVSICTVFTLRTEMDRPEQTV